MAKQKTNKTTKPKRGPGRPVKYRPSMVGRAYELAVKGYSDRIIAAHLGISHETYYTYQKKYPEFLDAILRGKALIDGEVESALLKRSRGYEVEEATIEYQIVQGERVPVAARVKRVHIPPDTGAAKHWLGNRARKDWGEVRQITGEGGGPVKIRVIYEDDTDSSD